jgi:hypothetical protein
MIAIRKGGLKGGLLSVGAVAVAFSEYLKAMDTMQ